MQGDGVHGLQGDGEQGEQVDAATVGEQGQQGDASGIIFRTTNSTCNLYPCFRLLLDRQ